jgi:hypothetical protein
MLGHAAGHTGKARVLQEGQRYRRPAMSGGSLLLRNKCESGTLAQVVLCWCAVPMGPQVIPCTCDMTRARLRGSTHPVNTVFILLASKCTVLVDRHMLTHVCVHSARSTCKRSRVRGISWFSLYQGTDPPPPWRPSFPSAPGFPRPT